MQIFSDQLNRAHENGNVEVEMSFVKFKINTYVGMTVKNRGVQRIRTWWGEGKSGNQNSFCPEQFTKAFDSKFQIILIDMTLKVNPIGF